MDVNERKIFHQETSKASSDAMSGSGDIIDLAVLDVVGEKFSSHDIEVTEKVHVGSSDAIILPDVSCIVLSGLYQIASYFLFLFLFFRLR